MDIYDKILWSIPLLVFLYFGEIQNCFFVLILIQLILINDKLGDKNGNTY